MPLERRPIHSSRQRRGLNPLPAAPLVPGLGVAARLSGVGRVILIPAAPAAPRGHEQRLRSRCCPACQNRQTDQERDRPHDCMDTHGLPL